MNTRLTEIADIWKQNQWLYGVGGFLLGLLVYPGVNRLVTDIIALLGDLVPEAVGIVVTVFLIDRISEARAETREEQRRIRERNERLVREIGSPVNNVAKNAVDEAQKLGLLWYEDNILEHANLSYADLTGANLEYANLYHTCLEGTNLKDAHLHGIVLVDAYVGLFKGANFTGATMWLAQVQNAQLRNTYFVNTDLQGANLRGANLERTNINNANLVLANCEGVNLAYSKLEGANLSGANLNGAILYNAKFNENTILPDANWTQEKDEEGKTIYDKHWTAEIDMKRYTDPDHKDKDGKPDFWQPEWAMAGFDSWEDWNANKLEKSLTNMSR